MPGYAYVVYSDDDENQPAIIENLRSATPEINFYTFDGRGYDDHLEEIRERTAGCTVFVPILSQRSARLPWMRSMTEVAIQADRPILAVRFGVRRVGWLPADVATVSVDPTAEGTDTNADGNLVTQLRLMLQDEQPPASPDSIHLERIEDAGPDEFGPEPEESRPASGVLELPTVTIGSITDAEALIRYAVAARLDRTSIPLSGVATDRVPESTLAACLTGEQSFTPEILRVIDETIVVAGGSRFHDVSGLAAHAARMRELTEGAAVHAAVPMQWTEDTLATASEDEVNVLVQATILLRQFTEANRVGVGRRVVSNRNREAIKQVTDRLILLACGPATPRHHEAQSLLGSLAKFTFDTVSERLTRSIQSPLGFRAWRPLTQLVMIARGDETDVYALEEVRRSLPRLIRLADSRWRESLYAGRALDLEFLIAIPMEWTATGETDPVNDALRRRAMHRSATLRERAMAATGLWERAFDAGRTQDETVVSTLADIIAQFREEAEAPQSLGDGLIWVADTLEAIMRAGVKVWDDHAVETNKPAWLDVVCEEADALADIVPPPLREATAKLFRQTLLQNAGVVRRNAIDTLAAGGWGFDVSDHLGGVLRHPDTPAWLRVRALFALGLIRDRDLGTEDLFVSACREAYRRVAHGTPTRAETIVLQTALFSTADVFGVTGAEDDARTARSGRVRDKIAPRVLRPVFDWVMADQADKQRWPVARALAYLLIFMAQPPRGNQTDLSRELLEKLQEHADGVTGQLSEWALGFRFRPDGTIQPMLHALSTS